MKARSTALLILTAALAASNAVAQDTFKLLRTPKVGATAKYSIEANMTIMGQEGKFSATLLEKVVKIEDNGDLIVEQTTSEGKASFGGQDFPIEQETGTMKYKPNGEILEINSPVAEADNNRREFLNLIVFPADPVKAGQKWTHEVKAAPISGNTPGKGEYECLGLQKVGSEDAVAIKYSYTETSGATPASGGGTVWFSPKDGSLIKAEVTFKNAPLPTIGPSNMSVVIKKSG